jgi:hypothetical protein
LLNEERDDKSLMSKHALFNKTLKTRVRHNLL